MVSVLIVKTISKASVTAYKEGTYQISQPALTWWFFLLIVTNYEGTIGNYLVKPNNPIVGPLHKTNENTCVYNKTN